MCSTHSLVGALLSGVLAAPSVHLDVHVVDDVEEVLDDRHALVDPLLRNGVIRGGGGAL